MCSSILQTNTFQGVIISDGVKTYYVFSYACGEIQWSGLGDETAIIGYNSNAQYYSNHPANGLIDIGQIVSCSRQPLIPGKRNKRQTGIAGLSDSIDANELLMLCCNISEIDSIAAPDIYNLRDARGNNISSLPVCPITRDQIGLSSHIFDPFPLQDENCFRSNDDNTFAPLNTTNKTYIFVSVCCYTDDG